LTVGYWVFSFGLSPSPLSPAWDYFSFWISTHQLRFLGISFPEWNTLQCTQIPVFYFFLSEKPLFPPSPRGACLFPVPATSKPSFFPCRILSFWCGLSFSNCLPLFLVVSFLNCCPSPPSYWLKLTSLGISSIRRPFRNLPVGLPSPFHIIPFFMRPLCGSQGCNASFLFVFFPEKFPHRKVMVLFSPPSPSEHYYREVCFCLPPSPL